MESKKSAWITIRYILLAIIPILIFKTLATVTAFITQIALTAKHYSEGGNATTAITYIQEVMSGENSIKLTALIHIVSFILGLLILLAGMKRNDFKLNVGILVEKDSETSKTRFSGKGLLIAVKSIIGVIFLMTGAAFLTMIMMGLLGMIAPDLMGGYHELMDSSGLVGFTFASILTTLVLAPLNEEVLFRGISFGFLKKANLPFAVVNVIQALFFGITHLQFMAALSGGIAALNIVQGLYAFVLGLFLGYVRERSGSLWGSIFAHFVFNFVGTFVAQELSKLPETAQFFTITVGGLVLTVLGILMIVKRRSVTADE